MTTNDNIPINDWTDWADGWELELATRRTADAVQALIPRLEEIGDLELLDAITAYLQAVHDFVVVSNRIRQQT